MKLGPTVLVWAGRLTPTPLSREYTVRIRYARSQYPEVRLIDPPLTPEERKLLHHLYPDGQLCLHKPDDWNASMLLVDTTVPWTAEWLAHYELWKRTHRWYGDRDIAEGESPIAGPTSLRDPPRNRADRRRAARAEARRARRERSGPMTRP